MNRKILASMLVLAAVGFAAAQGVDPVKVELGKTLASFFGSSAIAAAIGLGLAAGGAGIGMGLAVASFLQGMTRQPELTNKLLPNLMIGLAFIEAQVLYVLFIAILLIFANPFTAQISKLF